MATLLNYDPEKSLAWNKKALEKKDDIIAVVDKICADGFSNSSGYTMANPFRSSSDGRRGGCL